VNLQLGWNIISNPFERSVAWSDVVKVNSLLANSVIYDWKNGAWAQVSTMTPYSAYYYLNVTNAASISIPYDPAGSLTKTAKEQDNIPYVSKQAVQLSLSSNGKNVASVYAGFDSTSCTDYDGKDYFAPPSAFAMAGLVIENDAQHMPIKRLYIDHRKEVGAGQIFNLVIQNNTNSVSYLYANGMQSLPNDEVYLYNLKSHMSFNLKQAQQIPISSGSESVRYQLVIGPKTYLQTNGVPIAPTDFMLSQNYPNPFNPSTTIRYGLPSTSHVSILIYNTLGQQVADLINGEQSEGWHEVLWMANVTTGLYFYRLEAVNINKPNNRFVQVRKMLLLR
jgi:hypothetical protein